MKKPADPDQLKNQDQNKNKSNSDDFSDSDGSYQSNDELAAADANKNLDTVSSKTVSPVTDVESVSTEPSTSVTSDSDSDTTPSSSTTTTVEKPADPFLTPPRLHRVRVKKKNSPHGSSQPGDERLAPLTFSNTSFLDKLYDIKNDFSQFLQNVISSDGNPVAFNKITIKENSESSPFNRVGLNTHSDFCDRNPTYNDKSPKSFHRLVQCCAALTRNIDMSMIFLNHGNNRQIACYPRFKESIEDADQVRLYSLTDHLDRVSRDFMETYNSLDISEVKVKDSYGNFTSKKRSLIVNVGLITVCDTSVTPHNEQEVAIITGNGQFQKEYHEFDEHLKAIEASIKRTNPDIVTYRVCAKDTPVASNQWFHCESLCAELIGMKAERHVLSNRMSRKKGAIGSPPSRQLWERLDFPSPQSVQKSMVSNDSNESSLLDEPERRAVLGDITNLTNDTTSGESTDNDGWVTSERKSKSRLNRTSFKTESPNQRKQGTKPQGDKKTGRVRNNRPNNR